MSHTPGPWIITSYNYFIRSNSEDVVIAEIYQGDYIEGRPSFRCGQANANLIAAAPDLLEACKLLMTFNLADVIASAGGTPYSEKIEWFDFVHLVERAVAKGESL